MEVTTGSQMTSKMLDRLKNQRLILDPYEWGRHRANLCPQNWRDRQADKDITTHQSRDPQAEISAEAVLG